MNKALARTIALAMSLLLEFAPLAAQQRKDPPAAPKQTTRARPEMPAPTFDTLLAADDYKVYGEIKNVGQLIRSANVADILDPILKLGGPPKEFKSLVKFANAHAEVLTTSRMLIAFWPAKTKLPQALFAIEFSSPEEASKFEPQLREFLPSILPQPTPTPTVETTEAIKGSGATGATKTSEVASAKPTEPPPPPFVLKQFGKLVLISDTTVNFKDLRPADSKPLFDDQNFRQAYDRFASEQIFLYFNVALNERGRATAGETQVSVAGPMADETKIDEPAEMSNDDSKDQDGPEALPDLQTAEMQSPPMATVTLEAGPPTGVGPGPGSQEQRTVVTVETPPPDPAYFMMLGAIFGGTPKWPEAVGAAISFEGDTYVARVLLVGGAEGRASPVPFISQWVSGPELTLESPSLLPADTELFVAASLDAPQIYAGMVKSINEQAARYQRVSRQPAKEMQPEAPFAELEKKLGLKFKEDLLPVLGNEVAVSVPVSALIGAQAVETPLPANADGNKERAAKKPVIGPALLISLKDKEAARLLMPKIIEGLGFKGAGMLAQTEKRDDTEIVSYANVFSYAFMGRFLVLSADAATTKHVVDSYLNHQTLAADSQFRNYTRWQPRQVLGQVYVSPLLMENYRTYANRPTALMSDKVREFLTRLNPVSDPLTYALSSDGLGPLHEIHVPKNLILMAVAGISADANQSPLVRNESMARGGLLMIAGAEARYREDQGKGHYATLDQLVELHLVSKEFLQNNGYKYELTVSGDKFEASAVPMEYGKTGKLSYFVDQSSIVRGGDHAGGPASVSDSPAQ